MPNGIWFHGPTGSGKTTRAYASAPALCTYSYEGGLWDGLGPQHTHIIIDNITSDTISHRALCRLLDSPGVYLQTSNGRVQSRAATVIVTSCSRPDEVYESDAYFTEDGHAQLLRRFVVHSSSRSKRTLEESDDTESEIDASETDEEWDPDCE